MKQEELNIYKFKKGDLITRLKPMEEESSGEKDYTFTGAKLTFLGIANASIYISRPLDVLAMLFSGGRTSHVIQLPLELWEDGWGYYVEPDFLDPQGEGWDDEEVTLQDQIDQAIIDDNFEKAQVLQRKLEQLRKIKKDGKE